MADGMKVDAATLDAAARDVRSARSDVDGRLKALSNVMGELAAGWQGAAGGSVQTLMQRWAGDTNRLLHALDSIADTLQTSGQQHAATDEQQQQDLNKFNAALNG